MKNVDFELATASLLEPNLTKAQFDNRWISFLVQTLPRLDAPALVDFLTQKNGFTNQILLTTNHLDLLDEIARIATTPDPQKDSFTTQHLLGFALDRSCNLKPEQSSDWVFENLPSELVARELLSYQMGVNSENLVHFLEFLESKDVIQLHEWAKSKRWPLGPIQRTPQQPNKPTSAVHESAIRLSEQVKLDFPRLQEALDRISSDQVYPTVEPIIKKIAADVIANGKLTRHFALLGPAGVGKTESSKIIHDVLYALNVCGPDFNVFSPGADSKNHIDEMAHDLSEILNTLRETGGVLLMDEAGKYFERELGANSPGNFRKRTLDVVMEQLDELLDDGVVVVFAGYQAEFQEVLSQDDGFHRRIWQIPVQPPSVDLMADFVVETFMAESIQVPGNMQANVKWLFTKMVEDSSISFGYWATAGNFIKAAKASARGDVLTGENDHGDQILAEDFIAAANDVGYINSDLRNLKFTAPFETGSLELELGALDTAEGFNRQFGFDGDR